MKLVCVKVCANGIEAEVVKGLLETHGIRVVLIVGEDHMVATGSGGARNVRVMVNARQAREARSLLAPPSPVG